MPTNPSSLQRELNKRRPFESLEQEALLSILRAASQLSAPFEQLFREYGLSNPMFNALRIIRSGGPRGRMCSEISSDLVSRVPDVTRLVDRLEKAGLATRARCKDDRRAIFVTITARGSEALSAIDGPLMKLHQEVLGHLSSQELTQMCDLLAKARAPLNAKNGSQSE
jgi:DNA-binding MarR family transcriptional regulator